MYKFAGVEGPIAVNQDNLNHMVSVSISSPNLEIVVYTDTLGVMSYWFIDHREEKVTFIDLQNQDPLNLTHEVAHLIKASHQYMIDCGKL